MNKGYFAIGLYAPKIPVNLGVLWRSAQIYGAAYVFTVGCHYTRQRGDTTATERHIPLLFFRDLVDLREHMPAPQTLVAIERFPDATSLETFEHPQAALYLLGPENGSLPRDHLQDVFTVRIPEVQPYSVNVAVAGSIVMYDRLAKYLQRQATVGASGLASGSH